MCGVTRTMTSSFVLSSTWLLKKALKNGILDRKGTWLMVLADFLVDQAIDGHRLAIAQIDAGAGGAHKEVGQVDRACRRESAPCWPVRPPLGRVNWVEMFMPISPFSSTYLTVLSMIGSGAGLLDGICPTLLSYRQLGRSPEGDCIAAARSGADAAGNTEDLLALRLHAARR